jgi:putative membrane protein
MNADLTNASRDRVYVPIVWAVSVIVPVVVTILIYMPKGQLAGWNLNFLPLMNACINSAVSVLLLLGYYFIRTGKQQQHKVTMLSAMALSVIFLLSYILYHYQAQETKFGGVGAIRYIYFFILLTHIVLATTIVPLALFTVYRSLSGQYERHKKIARWTFPLWLYVSVTGVVVYLMISPYYSH